MPDPSVTDRSTPVSPIDAVTDEGKGAENGETFPVRDGENG